MKNQPSDYMQQTERRSFITRLMSGMAALGFATVAPGLSAKAGTTLSDESDPNDIFSNMKGSQRIVFDATQPHGVYPFAWPRVFLMTNEMTGAAQKDCSVLVVLRHTAIGYAMQSEVWEKYQLGKVFEANDPRTNEPATRNPFWQPKPDDFVVPGIGPVQIGINQLQDNGITFCVCEMAMTVYSAAVGQQANKPAADVLADFKKAILPGIHTVPSGVWALGRAQKAGCGYIFAG